MTASELAICTGARIDRATEWLPYLTEAMMAYEINTPLRKAMFLAQIGHESAGLRYTQEIWGPTAAQARYEGRAVLGNNEPGDGIRFCGRGLIQITGRANYRELANALSVDVIDHPELLSEPGLASMASAWWWQRHGLNWLADVGDVERATRRINGGLNGLGDRMALYTKALRVLA